MAYYNNLKTNVATKFSTGSSTIICIFLMMAWLLEPVESPVITAPATSSSVGATGQETSRAYWQLRPHSSYNQT